MPVEQKVELKKGLRNVYIDRTKTSFIDGKEGRLLYRGYNIDDLAQHSTFEETAYLLIRGTLPTTSQLDEFDAQLKASRQLPDEIIRIIRLTKDSHPMEVLRTTISAMSSFATGVSDQPSEETLQEGIRLTAAVPTIVSAHSRIRDGREPVPARSDLSHAANFLYMLFGKTPDPRDAKLIDKDLVLHAEHGSSASGFAARVVASTRADLYAAITTGIAALNGPLHGGAAEQVMKIAQEIGCEENAAAYVANRLKSGARMMGFGHAVYRTVDPRSVHLRSEAKALGERKGQPQWFAILEEVTRVMEPYARKGINPNVDFWAGAVYYLLDIPEDLFISIFAIGRLPGWIAQIMEQYVANALLRPRLLYNGPMDLEYVPIEQRG